MTEHRVEFGVSPAFVASLSGGDLSTASYRVALPQIKALGFSGFQPEVADAASLSDWAGRDARLLAQAARDLGLAATQFVAHFMERHFSTFETASMPTGLDDLKRAVDCVKQFADCAVLTIPVLPMTVDWTGVLRRGELPVEELWRRRAGRVRECLDVVAAAGLNLAIEILPFSFVGGFRRFLDMCLEPGAERLGVNLDTAHAWACGELLPILPLELRGRIFGTHLSDLDGRAAGRRAPGKGEIAWRPFLSSLSAAGYAGSLDLEIVCRPDRVASEYSASMAYLASDGIEHP